MNSRNPQYTLAQFGAHLLTKRKIMITTHKSPDGDGFGCQLALRAWLTEMGKEVSVITVGEIANRFRFLPGSELVQNWESLSESEQAAALEIPDLILVVDTHKWEMLGSLGDVLSQQSTPVVFLDHHQNDKEIPGGYFLDADASSTGEIAYRLLCEMKATITPVLATCLYTAITYDTNSFKYLRQRGETLRIGGALVDAGADTSDIYRNIFASNSLAKVRLIGKSISNINLIEGGTIAWTVVPQQLLKETGAAPDDMRELITYLLEIDCVEIAITFKDRGNGILKISLRSKGRFPVRDIAVKLGGGGHLFAAGGEASGETDEIVKRVLNMAREVMTHSGYHCQSDD